MPDRFRDHRSRLAEMIGAEGMAVVPAAAETVRNSDVTHEFRQDSDFFYLTGFEEPDAVCVIIPKHPDGEFHLFVRPRDREAETWNGFRAGVEGATRRYQADAAHPLSELDSVLPRLMLSREAIYYRLGDPNHDKRIAGLIDRARTYRARYGDTAPTDIRDVSSLLGELRLVKSPAEIESIAAACELTAEGHREAMRFARPGMYEYQVQAAMEFLWREGGSRRNGYPSIVASGPNANVLHYVDNDRMLEDGDLVLVDAGAEVDYYSADVTRTFPANGVFTAPQRAVYEVVLAAHYEAVRHCGPGVTLADVHDRSRRVLTTGMVELGLLPRGVEDSLAMHHYRQFFMHGTSHWLGLDVHDAGARRVAGAERGLTPGMVFTVEPGIYISADLPEVEFVLHEYDLELWMQRRMLEGPAAKAKEDAETESAMRITHPIPPDFLGIGIRLEDDILITAEGHENLTRLVPTDLAKVEAVCAEGSWLHRI